MPTKLTKKPSPTPAPAAKAKKQAPLTFEQLPAYLEKYGVGKLVTERWQHRITDYFQAEVDEKALKARMREKGYAPGEREKHLVRGWQVQEIGSYKPEPPKNSRMWPSDRRQVLVTPIGKKSVIPEVDDEDEEAEE